MKKSIEACGKPVQVVTIQDEGGAANTTAKGVLTAQHMAVAASRMQREECPPSELNLGLKCGSSDKTSGLAVNPAVGVAVERLVGEGATAILGEVTEVIGAEHLLAKQCKDANVASDLLKLVDRMEQRVKAMGVDMRGGQPTPAILRESSPQLRRNPWGRLPRLAEPSSRRFTNTRRRLR
jgi:altronate dehydratase large subunit